MGTSIGLLPILLLLWSGLITLTGIVALWRCAGFGTVPEGPRCGACHEFLTSDALTCARCDGDLRRVGISTPLMAFRQRSTNRVVVRASVVYSAGALMWALLFLGVAMGSGAGPATLAFVGVPAGALAVGLVPFVLLKRRAMLSRLAPLEEAE